jgi:hypothetical protein
MEGLVEKKAENIAAAKAKVRGGTNGRSDWT